MDFTVEGILKGLGLGLTIGGTTGGAGLKQEAIAAGLGVIESTLQKMAPQFKMGASDFTVFGSIKYWDEIIGKIKDANQNLGIAGELGTSLQSSFREAYPLVVDMGITAEQMAKSVESYFEKTGRAQALSSNQMAELAKMAKVFGDESIEIASTYSGLGLSITATTSRMRNLIKESDKFGVLPKAVSGILKNNLDVVNKYSFKNGVKALEQMSIYAARTNTDLKSALTVADKILEGGIEGTMELSTELQLLGGSFGNIGNMSELIYLARNDVGEFNKIFNQASAQMAKFNEETGQFEYTAYDMDVLRKVASATGVSLDNLTKGGRAAAKELMLKDELDASVRGLQNYDELLAKVSGAAYRNQMGEWVVKMKKDGKEIEQTISSLTEDQIKQISFTDETKGPEEAFENIAKSNEKLEETLNRLIEQLKVESLSTAAYEQFNVVARNAAENIKEVAKPFIDMFQSINKEALDNLLKVVTPLSEGNIEATMTAVGENLVDAGNTVMNMAGTALSEVGTILLNAFKIGAKYIAAGIEWGFRNSIGYLQQGIIWVYDNTFGAWTGMKSGISPETNFVPFEDIEKKYFGEKGTMETLFEGTETKKMFEGGTSGGKAKTAESGDLSSVNKSTEEMKRDIGGIQEKLTAGESISKVEVVHKGDVKFSVDGKDMLLSAVEKEQMIKTFYHINMNPEGTVTSRDIQVNTLSPS